MARLQPSLARVVFFLALGSSLLSAACGARSGLDDGSTSLPTPSLVCPGAFAHCDRTGPPVCDTDLGSSNESCGACGQACAAGLVCARGACHEGGQIVQLAAGGYFTCALRASGQVLCWGQNETGELGRGNVGAPGLAAPVVGLDDAVEVAAGNVACARRRNGTVACWGNNQYGWLGDGTTQDHSLPSTVLGIDDAASIGGGAVCVLRRDATLWCWGSDNYGELANGVKTAAQEIPSRVVGLDGLVDFFAGVDATCAIAQGGQLSCWGVNGFGSVGDGTGLDPVWTTPLPVMAGVTNVASSTGTCAADVAGGVRCWGSRFASLPSEPVPGLDEVHKVTVGVFHRCALRRGGNVRCWGDATQYINSTFPVSGLLGDGGKTPGAAIIPVDVVGLADAVVDVSAGSAHTCALRAGGAVVCWGDNSRGQIGDGTARTADAPVEVVGL